ncbi:aspartyl protease family protein [Qipengyuania sp. ASV99]|uniref:aspartyl protease family protein n=1 Tax=Qipengyuania sp. ASV99 TaxID=3399681 RepID=UPI003A4C7A0D
MKYVWAMPAIAASLAASLIGSGAAHNTISNSAIAAAVEPPLAPPLTTGPSAVPPAIEPVAPNLADPATEVLDLERDAARRLTVPVMIEGAGPYDFMIDTGSQATAVTHQINEGLQLTPFGTATLVGMASSRPVNVVEVDSMTFGSHTIRDLISPVLDRQHVGADGIIGLDSLQDFRVLIDFREETITLQDVSVERGSRSGFEIIVRARQQLGQLLITNAVVEGVSATVIIDTGAQGSIGNLALRERLRNARAQEVTTTDVNGVELVGQLSTVRTLNVGGLQMRNVALAFADTPAFDALGLSDEPVISLGMQHLRLFDRVAIDFASQRILFDVPRDVARELRRQRHTGYGAVRQ